MRTLTMEEAREQLAQLPDQLAAAGESHEAATAAITCHGKPALAVMPWDVYEGLIETLEILGDEELMKDLRESIKQAERGEGIPLDEALAKLGWT